MEFIKSGDFDQLLFSHLQKGQNYIYRGPFTARISESILSLFESSLEDHESIRQIKRRVYHIMVEGLQNATRHQAVILDNKPDMNGVFILRKELFSYYIITGNLVSNDEKQELVEKIRKVNYLTPDKIDNKHKNLLLESANEETGGAALGLLEMARKSGNKFLYSFKKLNEDYSYFYLLTEIPARQQDIILQDSDLSAHFDDLPILHDGLNKENIMLLFNSLLNQENLVNLIAFVEKEIDESTVLKKRLYTIMIEMIQNVILHSDSKNENDNVSGSIFFISQDDANYYLNSGNYIRNDKTDDLKKRINHINGLDKDELNKFYNQRLFELNEATDKSPGLGLSEIRLKSGNIIEYQFVDFDPVYSFYKMRVKLSKF